MAMREFAPYCQAGQRHAPTGDMGRGVANVLDIARLQLTETGPVAGTMGEAAL